MGAGAMAAAVILMDVGMGRTGAATPMVVQIMAIAILMVVRSTANVTPMVAHRDLIN
jgi:hypothetical protein